MQIRHYSATTQSTQHGRTAYMTRSNEQHLQRTDLWKTSEQPCCVIKCYSQATDTQALSCISMRPKSGVFGYKRVGAKPSSPIRPLRSVTLEIDVRRFTEYQEPVFRVDQQLTPKNIRKWRDIALNLAGQ